MTTSMAAKHAASKRLKDAIFGASAACAEAAKKYGADKVTNATMGVMIDDEGKLASIPTMERVFRSLSIEDYTRYAPIPGLPDYLDAVIDLTFAEQKPEGYLGAIATAGGTGAIHHAVANYAERGDKVLTADWFWGTYNVICNECGCQLTNYQLFDENQNFNIADYTAKVDEIMKQQDSLLVIINTPAHNPTGFSLTEEDWDNVLALTKKYASQGKKMSILVDIAYIDYSYNLERSRDYMNAFNRMNDQVMIVVAFSCSKTLTSYGLRCGGAVILARNQEDVRALEILMEKHARASWSNIPNAAMENFVKVTTEHKDEFNEEKGKYVDLLRQRCEVFKKEADECGLTYYPYKEGFFVTLKVEDDDLLTRFHEAMLAQDIYTIKVNKGIRVALCSLSVEKCQGLAFKMKEILDSLK